jgi:hypothetical protein
VQQWEYKVVLVDYRGRISIEGEEATIGSERRTAFVRRTLDQLGAQGWELAGIQTMDPHTAYYVFKRQAGASTAASGSQTTPQASTQQATQQASISQTSAEHERADQSDII